MPQSLFDRIIYAGILIAFVILAILFAWRVPNWQAPDEPAHYNYIAQVASGELLPIIEMGDWNNDYLEALKANDFADEFLTEFDTIQYEDHQPPLYYWLSAPVFILTNGNLFALRIVSLVLACFIVALTYSITVSIFPQYPHLGLATMALVGFLPQNLHILASVNNDALAGLVIAILLLLCIHYLKRDNVAIGWIGLCVGIAFISKTTIYFMAGLVLIVIFMRWWLNNERDFSDLLKQYLGFGVPAGLFALIYWGRNIATYGFPDFLGLQAHDAVVVGQLRRSEFIQQFGNDAYWREAFFASFHSFWGQFGWMEARLADAMPIVLAYIVALILIALSGLALNAFQRNDSKDDSANSNSEQNSIWIMLILMILLALAQYVYYNISFVQFQGRYLFVAIIPFAIAMVLGVDVWRRQLLGYITPSICLTVALFAVFAPVDFYLIWRVIPCALGC